MIPFDPSDLPGSRGPLRLALMVGESDAGEAGPVAEAIVIVEVPPAGHLLLADHAVDAGFVVAGGIPPATSAEIHVHDRQLVGLTLVAGLHVWQPEPPAALTELWIDTARERGSVVIVIVPPDTFPPEPIAEAEDRDARFMARVDEAYDAGLVLTGTARLIEH